MIFNVIKLKLNDINLSNYAVEIVFETICHGNGRSMTYNKEFHYQKKDFVSDLIFFLFFLKIGWFSPDLGEGTRLFSNSPSIKLPLRKRC